MGVQPCPLPFFVGGGGGGRWGLSMKSMFPLVPVREAQHDENQRNDRLHRSPPRPPPATPNSTLTLLQTENVTREPLGKRSSALSNSIMNSFIRCLVPAKRASVLQANDVGMSARPTRLYTRAMMCFPRGLEMPNYITLGNWTEQGIKNVKESPKRADAVAALANKLGAKMQIFYTMGRY